METKMSHDLSLVVPLVNAENCEWNVHVRLDIVKKLEEKKSERKEKKSHDSAERKKG